MGARARPGTIERTPERAAPPRLVRRLAPDGPGRRWKDERRVGRPAASEAPRAEVRGERRQEPDCAMRCRLRVLLLTERYGSLDQDRLIADVAPLQRQRFPGLSPAYARTLISVASHGELAARIRSIANGASGRTSGRRGRGALRTARAGLVWICPLSNAC